MKTFIIYFFIISNVSCAISEGAFEKEFYERVSGMKFPAASELIETCSNGEFYTTTILKVDSSHLAQFIIDYKLDTLKTLYPSQHLGGHCLKGKLPALNNSSVLYYKTGSSKKNSWLYIIDIEQKLFWAEIQFPDFAGN